MKFLASVNVYIHDIGSNGSYGNMRLILSRYACRISQLFIRCRCLLHIPFLS